LRYARWRLAAHSLLRQNSPCGLLRIIPPRQKVINTAQATEKLRHHHRIIVKVTLKHQISYLNVKEVHLDTFTAIAYISVFEIRCAN
jgi:hypothetical protein